MLFIFYDFCQRERVVNFESFFGDDNELDEDDNDVEGNLLTPAGASLRTCFLRLKVFKAEELTEVGSSIMKSAKKFLSGSSKTDLNPYLQLKFAGKKRKTKDREKTSSPEWNTELSMPFNFPSMCDTLEITLKSRADFKKKYIIGETLLHMSHISTVGNSTEDEGFPPTFGPAFVNFYGSPREPKNRCNLDKMDTGKVKGCAYRGRVLLEIVTSFEEDEGETIQESQEITDEVLQTIKPYYEQEIYRLAICFDSAGGFEKLYEDVQFEVSIGNYGNKLDKTSFYLYSVTDPSSCFYDNCKYYYLSMTYNKPVVVVTSEWENVNFRLYAINYLQRLCDDISHGIDVIRKQRKKKESEAAIAFTVVQVLDELISTLSLIHLPAPHSKKLSNDLDVLVHKHRKRVLLSVFYEAENLRQNCADIEEALKSLEIFFDKTSSLLAETQSSIPDVIIWMLIGKKRVAYYRLPAHEILFSPTEERFCGRLCGKPQEVFLKKPTTKIAGSTAYDVLCNLRISAWFGLREHEQYVDFGIKGTIIVIQEKFEYQSLSFRKDWKPMGYMDKSGKIDLPDESFVCPSDWQLDEDWKLYPNVQEQLNKTYSRVIGWEYGVSESGEFQSEESPSERFRRRRWVRSLSFNLTKRPCSIFDLDDKTKGLIFESDRAMKSSDSPSSADPELQKVVNNMVSAVVTAESMNDSSLNMLMNFYNLYHSEAAQMSRESGSESFAGYTSEISSSVADQSARVGVTIQIPEIDSSIEVRAEDTPEPKKKMSNFLSSTSPKKKNEISDSLSVTSSPRKKSIFSKITDHASDSLTSSKSKIKKELALKHAVKPKIFMMYETAHKLQLRAYIYQGRGLLPMEKTNFSDPVLFLSFLNQCRRTVVSKKTLNPFWDQTLIVDIIYYGDLEVVKNKCQILLEVYHRKGRAKLPKSPFKTSLKPSSTPLKGKVTFMGRAMKIPQFQTVHDLYNQEKLTWIELMKGNSEAGSLLAAFDLYLEKEDQKFPSVPPLHPSKKYNDVYKIPLGIRPVMQSTVIEIVIWGVRNMRPFRGFSITNPLVIVQIGDVEIRTKPVKKGKQNPNFSDPLYMKIANLPKQMVYFPPITLRVKDNRSFGSRPTVGQCVITDVTKYIRTTICSEPEVYCDYASKDDEDSDDSLCDRKTSVIIEVDDDSLSDDFDPIKKRTSAISELSSFFDRSLSLSDRKSSFFSNFATPSKLGFGVQLNPDVEEEKDEMQGFDWWTRYYASVLENFDRTEFDRVGLSLIKIYPDELEKQENFRNFDDFVETFKLTRGGATKDDEPLHAGELKGAITIYKSEEDVANHEPQVYTRLPSPSPVDLLVRIYVVCGINLTPQDPNGLADPYIRIKYGKKKINDKSCYIPNTLNPIFGRMFEAEVRIPDEKDLIIQTYDWDLIGSDDKVGETVVDLENRYFTRFNAWCGLPSEYEIDGPTPWRDQMTPKDMLERKCLEREYDLPVWNGERAVLINKRAYTLDQFEKNKTVREHWGEPEQRLSLYILRTFPHITEHVETRPLFSKMMPGIEQGRLQLWIDIFPLHLGPPEPPFDISPRKPAQYFLRVVVWNCADVPLVHTSMTGEKMVDIYVKGWMTGYERMRQKTDIHHRSLDGTGMFNWRFVFPFQYIPQEKLACSSEKEHAWSLNETIRKFPPVLVMQVWDNELFGKNQSIGEVVLPLTKMPKCSRFRRMCSVSGVPDTNGNCSRPIISLFEQKMLKGWWPLISMIDGERKLRGKIEMSMEIVGEDENEERPAGKARDEPNSNPPLDKPQRPATSFVWFTSPWKSFRYIIWRRYKWLLLGFLFVVFLTAFLVLLFYSLPSAIVSHRV